MKLNKNQLPVPLSLPVESQIVSDFVYSMVGI